jgi:hypothetical protein
MDIDGAAWVWPWWGALAEPFAPAEGMHLNQRTESRP